MRVAIIGGYGQMGIWFSNFYKSQGHSVIISGRDRGKASLTAKKLGVDAAESNRKAVDGADLVIVSILPEHFERVVKEIAPRIKTNQKVIDITSVKEYPVRIMHRYIRNATVLGTHPMFGPSANRQGQNFILTPTNAKETRYAKELKRYLTSKGFSVRIMTPQKHDAVIGMVLSLTHFIGLVTADSWKELGVERYMKTSSTSFRFLSEFVKSIVDSNPSLYSYLQMDVPDARRSRRIFIKTANSWIRLIERRDRKNFSRKMAQLSGYVNSIQKNWK